MATVASPSPLVTRPVDRTGARVGSPAACGTAFQLRSKPPTLRLPLCPARRLILRVRPANHLQHPHANGCWRSRYSGLSRKTLTYCSDKAAPALAFFCSGFSPLTSYRDRSLGFFLGRACQFLFALAPVEEPTHLVVAPQALLMASQESPSFLLSLLVTYTTIRLLFF